MKNFGLIGIDLSSSFSRKYFENKFKDEKINDCTYRNLEIPLELLKDSISKYNLKGFNVTMPYKTSILPLLDELSNEAKIIGAVNTVLIKNKKLIGFNTDSIGFEIAYSSILKNNKYAIIFGNGGASKSVQYVLDKLNIKYLVISRKLANYPTITNKVLRSYKVLINTTPLGMNSFLDKCVDIPYDGLTSKHFLIDLIYNPEETLFLKKGKQKGSKIVNGKKMLEIQADESWKIWNTK